MPEELWMEVHNTVQKVVIKTIPKKKKCKRQSGCLRKPYKYLSKEEKQKAKEKRKDKKAFLSDQCKEREENNKMGKTRDVFKKIRDTKGTFHTKMGMINDRNGMDLTEAEDIKKRWQEYTEELYKKIIMTQIMTIV